MDIGKKIIELREQKGWSQYRLFKEAKIGQSTLSQIEAGIKKSPNSKTLQKIASALGVSMAVFDDDPEIGAVHGYIMEVTEKQAVTKEAKAALYRLGQMTLDERKRQFLLDFDKLPEDEKELLIKFASSRSSSPK